MSEDPYKNGLQTEILGDERVRELVRALADARSDATYQAEIAAEVSVLAQTISEQGYLQRIARYGGLAAVPKAKADDQTIWRRRDAVLDWWVACMDELLAAPPDDELPVIAYLRERMAADEATDSRGLHLLATVMRYARIGQPELAFDAFEPVDPVEFGVREVDAHTYYAYRIDGAVRGAWLEPGPEDGADDTDHEAVLEQAVELALLDEVRLAHYEAENPPSTVELMKDVEGGIEFDDLAEGYDDLDTVPETAPESEVRPWQDRGLMLNATVDGAAVDFEAVLIDKK
jgi:hypothetical protein